MLSGQVVQYALICNGILEMKEISLENFRCFRGLQTVRLAPLTLLVGENSTGKSSFMALVRALWNFAYQDGFFDFKAQPYDLGTFDEIVHHRGGRELPTGGFLVGFKTRSERRAKRGNGKKREPKLLEFKTVFQKRGTEPFPVRLSLSIGETWAECRFKNKGVLISFGTRRGTWKITKHPLPVEHFMGHPRLFYMTIDVLTLWIKDGNRSVELVAADGETELDKMDYEDIETFCRNAELGFQDAEWIYASAPVRSMPQRTYDPATANPDPGGRYVPMYLAELYNQDRKEWERIKGGLERFGKDAGLFDEISTRALGSRDSEPFQLQVRKFAGGLKGPKRNLIDVGYGVSQALPVITELMRKNPPALSLLQQPEVHLHPSAQAALGTLFCKVAEPAHQLLIETHSDHLVDRVRMDVRDRTTRLKPEDVLILFFEREGLDVRIHSMELDTMGNVIGAPDTYRRFFLEETSRSLGV